MNKYEIVVSETRYLTLYIEAEDAFEAEDIVREKYGQEDIDFSRQPVWFDIESVWSSHLD